MCTIIRADQKGDFKTAKRNIRVYKYGKISESKIHPDKLSFLSPFLKFNYEKDVEYKCNFSYSPMGDCFDDEEIDYLDRLRTSRKVPLYVGNGFHSISTCNKDRLYQSYTYHNIGMFIIPKGAHYYITPAHCVVSNALIFKSQIQ